MAVSTNSIKDHHLIKVLYAVKKRPGMYVSPVNLNGLRNFLCGYSCSKLFLDEQSGDVLSIGDPDFYDWMATRESMQLSPSMGWVEMLEEKYSENEAFDKFFIYLDEYLMRLMEA